MSKSFSLGQVVVTKGALHFLNHCGVSPSKLLARHTEKDWGDVCLDDALLNNDALLHGGRIMSVYKVVSTQSV